MHTVLVYGDSLSWGIVPGTRNRWPFARRWAGVLEGLLGPSTRVVEEHLNGRTTAFDNPVLPGRNGLAVLPMLLESHAPLDVVAVMLGVNDLQRLQGLTARESALGTAALVDAIRRTPLEGGGTPPAILLVAPPPLGSHDDAETKFGDGVAWSREFAARQRAVATEKGCECFDAGGVIAASAVDGVHLDEAAHGALGAALAPVVQALLAKR
jgi:lysophospholipase L1-like esterase